MLGDVGELIGRVLDTLGAQSTPVVMAIVLMFLALEGTLLVGLFIPSDALLVVAGTTAGTPAEAAALVVTGVLGCAVGASGGHWLGRRYGSRLRHGRIGRRIGEERWVRAERLVLRSGWALAVAYFLPVAHALTPVIAGTFGMPYRRFMPWALAGSLAWLSTYITLGAVVGAAAREYQDVVVPVAAALGVLFAVAAALVRRHATRRLTADAPGAGDDGAEDPGAGDRDADDLGADERPRVRS
ncbi:membrane-associated protein [Thermocatellispora tengchongensis]|uniref:Membrane-associated protein n=1 Tax=Thermocatellispora tengchongensis TaxID=1073253 RepID=A0A840NZD9_9ACTN|nr:DedA family protein [Thermocatellispora tengchongensis]MBB5131021.1 membrane-associated protein [Thermocatellispora tengchongensis]